MKRRQKIMPIFAFLFVFAIGISLNNVYAARGAIVNGSFAGNLFFGTSDKGPATDHTSCTYSINGEPAWCIDAGVDVVEGEGYEFSENKDDSGALSWLMYNSNSKGGTIDNQYIQAAIWKLTGNNVTSDGGDLAYVERLIETAKACNNSISVSNAVIYVNSTNLKYDRNADAYISDIITVSNGNLRMGDGQPFGAYLADYNGGTRIIVPASNVTSDARITVVADCTSTATGYGPATVWRKTGSQTLITPSMKTLNGAGASVEFNLTAVGDLKVIKKDEHGKLIPGAQYRVTGGPDNINTVITTNEDGEAELLEIRIGRYDVVEIYVPRNLTIDSTVKHGDVVSGKTEKFYINHKNTYQRGELVLHKNDVYTQYGKKNYGDANFKDIVVGLYAAEDIYEGIYDESGLLIETTKTPVLVKDQLIATRTLRADGTTESVKEFTTEDGVYFDGVPIGNYYWKELETNASYLKWDEATVTIASKEKYETAVSYEGMNKEYSDPVTTEMYDQPVYGKVVVYKMDNDNSNTPGENDTDKSPAAGAVLRLTLKSNYNETTGEPIDATHDCYTATVDEKGRCEFINEEVYEFNKQNNEIDTEFTIPYGEYVIDEIETSDNGQSYYYGFQNEVISVSKNYTASNAIVMDEPIPFDLEIVKRDLDTGEIVAIAGAKFKIWDCQANDGKGGWLSQRLANSGEYTDEFVTNNYGYCILPEKLYAGEYVIYEKEAPEGYYLTEEYREPEDKSKLGDATVSGLKIDVKDTVVNVEHVEEYPEGGIDREYIEGNLKFTINMYDPNLRGNLDLYKTGEMFTDVTEDTSDYTELGFNDLLNEIAPDYNQSYLADVKFSVVAKKDIRTKDGRLLEKAGTVHYLTTGEDGHGKCTKIENGVEVDDNLFCGTYTVTEIETPKGYIPCESFDVVIENNDQYTLVKITNKDAENDAVPVKLNLEKIFNKDVDGVCYKPEREEQESDEKAYAIFGLYNETELTAVNGNVTIPAGTLIDSFVVYEDEPYVQTTLLPDGDYYLEELYAEYPYLITDEDGQVNRHKFTVNHKKGEFEPIEVNIHAENDFERGDMSLIKVSKSALLKKAGITLTSTDEDDEKIRMFIEEYSREMTLKIQMGEITIEELLNELREEGIKLLESAEYEVYVDKECNNHLQISRDSGATYENVILQSEKSTGLYTLKDIPTGMYYIKESKAPVYEVDGNKYGYEISDEVISVEIVDNSYNEQAVTFKVLYDRSSITDVEKVDIFTGKRVPDCLFTISDENGTEILRFITNEVGRVYIPIDIFESGKYYYFTELEAENPYYYDDNGKLYELNTEPHKFRAECEDGEWKFYAKNQRINEEGKLEEYGEEVENATIYNYRPTGDLELIKTDAMDSTLVPNCKFELRSLETDWVVEGVTDENGIYVFKNIPYGEYVYTELEAPEEYDIDTTPHYITIDAAHTKVVVQNVKTGDIAVIGLAVLAVASVCGIVFIIARKRKAKKVN